MNDSEPSSLAVDFQRFVSAQDSGVPSAYEMAMSELATGRKQSHWIWFIFPQLSGLGASELAQHYGISGVEMAKV